MTTHIPVKHIQRSVGLIMRSHVSRFIDLHICDRPRLALLPARLHEPCCTVVGAEVVTRGVDEALLIGRIEVLEPRDLPLR